MACLSVICNNGFFKSRELLGVRVGKAGSCAHRSLGGGLALFPVVKFQTLRKFERGSSCNVNLMQKLPRHDWIRPLRFRGDSKWPPGLFCRSRIEPGSDGFSDIERAYVRKGRRGIRRKFSLRLRPRFWLLASRFKRVSAMSMSNDLGVFLRKNLKRVTLSASVSVALGLCYTFLKVTALPSPKLVPYSVLIMSLQDGNVTKVLLEEGSRRIYYNTSSGSQSNSPIGTAVDVTEKNDVVPAGKMIGASMPKKFLRARAATRQWQYATRKIDHDEKFLLSLMREKVTIYSSAPRSWIPSTPLMWLLYRQLSAANSPAKKRRPNSQTVNFDDVEGVDAAKVELMETHIHRKSLLVATFLQPFFLIFIHELATVACRPQSIGRGRGRWCVEQQSCDDRAAVVRRSNPEDLCSRFPWEIWNFEWNFSDLITLDFISLLHENENLLFKFARWI
ncbi:hypothetical protein ACJRO7_035529 [Eucalyptus globulus]|uniref:Uncharacterized protein n=1 Tax=Eucalyptus globulus TaxID=34317 RepID=A0ABD3JGQ4_EUCGL